MHFRARAPNDNNPINLPSTIPHPFRPLSLLALPAALSAGSFYYPVHASPPSDLSMQKIKLLLMLPNRVRKKGTFCPFSTIIACRTGCVSRTEPAPAASRSSTAWGKTAFHYRVQPIGGISGGIAPEHPWNPTHRLGLFYRHFMQRSRSSQTNTHTCT